MRDAARRVYRCLLHGSSTQCADCLSSSQHHERFASNECGMQGTLREVALCLVVGEAVGAPSADLGKCGTAIR